MNSTDLANRSPLRALDKALDGGLERGQIGVVTARHGAGKTPFVVCVGLDHVFRGERILHVSLDSKVDHVREYYEQIFNEQAKAAGLDGNPYLHLEMERARRIHAYHGSSFSMEKLTGAIEFMREHASFDPDVIIIDTWDFSDRSLFGAWKQLATDFGAQLWMTAHSHREEPTADPAGVPAAIVAIQEELAVIIDLKSEDDGVHARVVKPQGGGELPFVLDPTTMLLKNL